MPSWSVGKTGTNSGTGTSLTVTLSGTTTAGNPLIAVVTSEGGSVSFPAGWSKQVGVTLVGTSIWVNLAGASVSSVTITQTYGTINAFVCEAVYSGGSITPAVTSSSTSNYTNPPTTTVTASGTAGGTAAFVVGGFGNNGGNTWLTTSGGTVGMNVGTGSTNGGLAIYTTGGSGSYSMSGSITRDDTAAGVMVILDDSSTGPPGANATLAVVDSGSSLSLSGNSANLLNAGLVSDQSIISFRTLGYLSYTTLQAGSPAFGFSGVVTTTLSVLANVTLSPDSPTLLLGGSETVSPTLSATASPSSINMGAGVPVYNNFIFNSENSSVSFSSSQSFAPSLGLVVENDSVISFHATTSSPVSAFSLSSGPSSLQFVAQHRTGPFQIASPPSSLAISAAQTDSGSFSLVSDSSTITFTIAGSTGPTGPYVYHIYWNGGDGSLIDYTDPMNPIDTVNGLSWVSSTLAYPSDNTFLVHTYDPVSKLEDNYTDTSIRLVLNSAGLDEATLPDTPSGLRAYPRPGGTALVTFSYSPKGGKAQASGFNVYLGVGSTPNYASSVATVRGVLFQTSYSVTITGLADLVTYAVGVRAFTNAGEEGNTRTVPVVGCSENPGLVDIVSVELLEGT